MRHTDGRQLAPREPADRCSKASVTKLSASAERASPVLIARVPPSANTCPRQAPALATFSRLRFRSRRYRGREVARSAPWRPDAGERRPARRIAGGEAFLQAFV